MIIDSQRAPGADTAVVDTLTSCERSRRMARIAAKDTEPEMIVRRLVRSMGYGYRLHRKDLPGKPDLVFAGRRKAILVHGCFWHRHQHCKLARLPKSRIDFWLPKLEGNKLRDRRNQQALEESGWQVLVVWECQTRDQAALARRLQGFLE